MLTYTAEIVSAATGEARRTDAEPFERGVVRDWQEGNRSCDCVRKRLWLQPAGEEPDDDCDTEAFPCGDGAFRVAALDVSDGRRIRIDEGAEPSQPASDASANPGAGSFVRYVPETSFRETPE